MRGIALGLESGWGQPFTDVTAKIKFNDAHETRIPRHAFGFCDRHLQKGSTHTSHSRLTTRSRDLRVPLANSSAPSLDKFGCRLAKAGIGRLRIRFRIKEPYAHPNLVTRYAIGNK